MNPPASAGPSVSVQLLIDAVAKSFVGKPEAVKLTIVALIARGHLLIEDVPGIGKTLLGVALARAFGVSFRRVQFTNDLLPSDILGLSIYDPKNGSFDFKPGPIFSHVLLADEINRSTPKTQSALLEAMSEGQVSIDGKTHALPDPFLVIATQNPVEYHGTFPLPEAQLDRFLVRVRIGYPTHEDELRILRERDRPPSAEDMKPVLTREEVLALQARVDAVHIDEALLDYAVRIAEASRALKGVRLGLSPRGALALARAARALAVVEGRGHCVPDDLKAVAVPVMAHRLLLDTSLYGVARVSEAEAAVHDLLRGVRAP
ncbi:MAG: AAA family ATPase [Elusimicrobia bacterium]|nr:AAA family ATPase [Elusimicrobiota bacterium]